MASITHRGKPITTAGELPAVGTQAPGFTLTATDMSDLTLEQFRGKRVVLNIYPSVDTGICAISTRKFNEYAQSLDNTVVVCVSKDLPFAHQRFCGAEGLENVISASEFKNTAFTDAYGVRIESGSLNGLMSRAVVVVDTDGTVIYTEQVPDIVQEPDYEKAIAALG